MKRIDLIKVEHNVKIGDKCEYIEPNVTEELLTIITNYMVNSSSINEALENIIKILIEKAKTYPDNYSIILCSLL